MKRITAILLATACSFFTLTAFAQEIENENDTPKKDQLIFNHLSAGVSFGLDGVGAHLAAPIGPHFSVRAGYTFIPSYNTTIPDMPIIGNKIKQEDLIVTVNEGSPDERTFDFNTVDFGYTINNFGPHLLVDMYPGKKSGFHFTVGAVMATSNKFLDLSADLSKQLDPSDYAHYGIVYKDLGPITTDQKGVLHADLRNNQFRPYLGIGFGRPLNMRHRVSVNFDLGVVYLGKSKLYTYDYGGVGGAIDDVEITSAKIENEDDGLIDDVLGKIPVFPVMKLSINVRLF